jgi:hypothetical protein
MTLRIDDERAVETAVRIANRFGVTDLHIRTPQDGAPNAITIEAETWIVRADGLRRAVSASRSTELIGDAELLPVLARAVEACDAYRAIGVPADYALYLGIRDVVYAVQKTQQRIPEDAV